MFVLPIDLITIKTPQPKCRLYWCLIEFIDWRYGQSCWNFRPLLCTSAPLTFSLVHLSPLPLPSVNSYCTGRGSGCVESICTGVIHCVFDQIPNLRNCFTAPNKNLGGEGAQTDKHLPQSPFIVNFFNRCYAAYLVLCGIPFVA